eukprot:5525005-Prymnesium_polylepis.1
MSGRSQRRPPGCSPARTAETSAGRRASSCRPTAPGPRVRCRRRGLLWALRRRWRVRQAARAAHRLFSPRGIRVLRGGRMPSSRAG